MIVLLSILTTVNVLLILPIFLSQVIFFHLSHSVLIPRFPTLLKLHTLHLLEVMLFLSVLDILPDVNLIRSSLELAWPPCCSFCEYTNLIHTDRRERGQWGPAWTLAPDCPRSSPGSDAHKLGALGGSSLGLGFFIYKMGTVLSLLWVSVSLK